MAASIGRVFLSRLTFTNFYSLNGCLQCRLKSTNKSDRTPILGSTADGSIILCWHPESKFPYEHSKPLPRYKPVIEEGDSVIKVQHVADDHMRHRPDGPTDSELTNIFFTTKHRWFPAKNRKYRSKKPLPVEHPEFP